MSKAVRPRISLLTDEDAGKIVDEACRVLETTGILVEHAEGRRILDEAGCVDRNGRHAIPERLVRSALSTAPTRIELRDCRDEPAMDLGGDRVHFDPGSAAIHILDSTDGRRREALSRDVADLVRLVDGLPHYAAQSTALTPSDVPAEVADRYRLYLALRYGRKPVVTGTFRKDGFAPMREMLAAVRGGETRLAESPLAIFDCCPSPPLKWSDLTCDALIGCARSRIPAELVSMPLAGATSPVTLRAAVVQHCAESLSGIVLHQLAAPGAPIIYGGAPAAFDMRHGTTPMGAIETMMIAVSYAQVGKHLGLPTHGYLGLSDAKRPDYQAGLESGIGAVLAALAGINVVSGPGMLDYLLTQSLEKLLLDHEACGMALRLVRGVEPRDEDAAALLADLVASGEFLSHPHTRSYWRRELSIPSPLIDRDTYGDWEAKGGEDAAARARAEVARRLGAHKTASEPSEIERSLDAIMQREAARHGMRKLPAI